MYVPAGINNGSFVALRKESVDRNAVAKRVSSVACWSLSARRAWIEMSYKELCVNVTRVALRKESVDRNELR